MRKRVSGFKDLLATLWSAVAGWLFFTLLLIILIGGIGVNRFISLQRAIATLATESSELVLLRAIREDLLALENASRYSGRDEPKVFLEAMASNVAQLKYQLDTLNSLVNDTLLLSLTDSLAQVLAARTKQLSALVQLKYAQRNAVMPESLLNEVEQVLAGKLDTTIIIRLDKYIQRREVAINTSEEAEVSLPTEQGKKNLIQQFRDFFGGKKKENTPKNREEISLTDSILQIEPLQADRREEVRQLLEAAKSYNSRLAASVQRKEIALRESGQQLQTQLNRLTETLESRFLIEQQARSRAAMTIARKAANMLALISGCGLLLGLALMLALKRLLRISALRQKQLEEEQKKVAELLTARQDLLGNISHELRTPLQAITGFANQLADAPAEKQRRWIALIKQSARQLSFLMGQLLQLNQLDGANTSLSYSSISLNILLTELDEIYAEKLHQKQLSWELIGDLDEEIHVITDPYRLRQILYNLLDNAVKYTAQGGVCLEIVRMESSLKFIITDTGMGIDKSDIPRLFEAYTQKEAKVDVLQSGIGLGLHLVRQLVEKFAGQLEVESEVKQGSTFTLTLPVTYDLAAKAEMEEKAVSYNLPLRIMVVDDDELNIELLRTALENKVAKISCFSTPDEALQAFKPGEYDVVLTDYRLPGQSGAALAATMKKQDRSGVYYLMTAAIAEPEARDLLSQTFNYLLHKPFDLEELLQLLKEETLRFYPEQCIDKTRVFNFLEGDQADMEVYLQKYKAALNEQLNAFEQALVSKDNNHLHEILHQLGSRVALLQLPGVQTLRELEKRAGEGRLDWQATHQANRMIQIFRRFMAYWT